MKLLALITGMLICSLSAYAQPTQIEMDFEKNKASFTREHFSEGEDASSGFDYLFYRRGSNIVKIRSIWSATHSKDLRIDDMYFDGGGVVVLRKFTAASRLLNTLKKGRAAVLTPKEEFHFTSGKLTKWIEGKSTKQATDPRWSEMETAMLDHARSMQEYYTSTKEEND